MMGRILALLFSCLGVFGLTQMLAGKANDPGLAFVCTLFALGMGTLFWFAGKSPPWDGSRHSKKDPNEKELKKLQGDVAAMREEMKALRESLADMTLMLHETQQTALVGDLSDRKGKR